jgi:hypothetical protein
MKKIKLRLEILWRLLTKRNVIFINYDINSNKAYIVTETGNKTKIDIAALSAIAKSLNNKYSNNNYEKK